MEDEKRVRSILSGLAICAFSLECDSTGLRREERVPKQQAAPVPNKRKAPVGPRKR